VSELLDRLDRLTTALLGGGGVLAVKAEFRVDDQRVRELAGSLLYQARGAVAAAELAYRRAHIPPPTRAQPFPPAAAIADAQALERLAAEIGTLEGRVRHQPVIEATRLDATGSELLAALIEHDRKLVERATRLQALVAEATPEALLGLQADVQAYARTIADTLLARELELR
jgi:hypothetical protein